MSDIDPTVVAGLIVLACVMCRGFRFPEIKK